MPAPTSERDVLEQVLHRERVTRQICAELNHYTDLQETLRTILHHVQEIVPVEAIAVRLQDGLDFPYFVYDGFSDAFVEHENTLCVKDDVGQLLRNPAGDPLLECMCGNVIRGRTDPTLPFFSPGGSFWFNHTTQLLASTTAEERQAHTRNYCNGCGYESVALVPIKARGVTVGLIQLNDHRQDRFTAEKIEFVEAIGAQVGLAVQNNLAYAKLQEALAEVQSLRRILPICARCKKVRNDAGYWQEVDDYLHEHADTQFTHGYCPECARDLLAGDE